MSTTFDEPLSPQESRIREAAEFLVEHMDPEFRRECEVLAQLEPGLSVKHAGLAGEWLEFAWAGRSIGAVSMHWIETGEGDLSGGDVGES